MYQNILIGVAPDHSRNSEAAIAIAKVLLKPGGKITALSVVESIPSYIAQQLPSGQMEKNIEDLLAALKADVGGNKGVATVVEAGNPAQTLLEYATEHKIDCIVVASHRPGFEDFFLGSTAARIVRHAQCSVHVLR